MSTARRMGIKVRSVAAMALFALVAALAWQAIRDQASSIEEVEDRFEQRIELAATYVESHLTDMRNRQFNYAQRQLGGEVVTAAQFNAAVLSFGFEAAVLLDATGHVLAIAPHDPTVTGTEIASQYTHLSAALAGHDSVSGVVPSAAMRRPIIAVAVPFETGGGRRVISGGYDVERTPLATFLAVTTSLSGREIYLVDAADQIVATTEVTTSPSLAVHAPGLVSAPTGAGVVEHHDADHFVVTKPVTGTRWRVIAAVPRGELIAPVSGSATSTWALVAATAVMAGAIVALLERVYRQRNRLAVMTRVDGLTGLANRGEAEAAVARSSAVSARTGRPWAVAMIDIDHFKQVNDHFGHATGDHVLRHVASVLDEESRGSELVARWGGEEFVLVLEEADDAAAVAAGERIAAAVRRSRPLEDRPVTVSVGVASAIGGPGEVAIARADAALYEAKAAGRDRVGVADPPELPLRGPDDRPRSDVRHS